MITFFLLVICFLFLLIWFYCISMRKTKQTTGMGVKKPKVFNPLVLFIWGSHLCCSRSNLTEYPKCNFFIFSQINVIYFCSIIFFILREFHGTNEYLCNNYDKYFTIENNTIIFFLRFWYYFSIMAVFHVKTETMLLKSNFWSQISASWTE